jgi:hypothetical protein
MAILRTTTELMGIASNQKPMRQKTTTNLE